MRRTKGFLEVSLFFLAVLIGMSGCGQKQQVGEIAPTEGASPTIVEVSSQSRDSSQTAASSTTSTPASNVTVVSASAPVSASPATSAPSAASLATALPKDSLERTRTIQLALKHAGFYGGNIDGKGGPLTQKAVEDFQKSKGLKVDGKVGPVTWAELAKYFSEKE